MALKKIFKNNKEKRQKKISKIVQQIDEATKKIVADYGDVILKLGRE